MLNQSPGKSVMTANMKKLSLDDLKVKSFTTSVNEKTSETLNGGMLYYKTLLLCAVMSVLIQFCDTVNDPVCAQSIPVEAC